MKLYRIILPVTDIARATAFYGELLGTPGWQVSPGRRYFDCEGVLLACYDAAADGDPDAPGPLPEHLYFAVDDLAAVLERCRRVGAALSTDVVPDVGPLGEIHDRPWGERSFYARDPFGNPLCFVDRATTLRAPS